MELFSDVVLNSILRKQEKGGQMMSEQTLQTTQEGYREGDLEEMRDILATAGLGTWHIELIEGEAPRMRADDKMLSLLGIAGDDLSPEEIYDAWFSRIVSEAVPSVLQSVENMKKGLRDENTYLWNHPQLGERYVRCGGTALAVPGGFVLRGYHYDVDALVREQQHQQALLKAAYLSGQKHVEITDTLGTLYTTVFLIDIPTHCYEIVKALSPAKGHVGKTGCLDDVLERIIQKLVAKDMQERMREFLDLDTLADRLQERNTVSAEHQNPNGEWYQSRFIVKNRDAEGRAVKALYVSENCTAEKRRELEMQEQLRKSALEARRANLSKTDFLRRMSHDIRTPLNGIIGMLKISERYKNDPVKLEESKRKILHSADYLLDLVNNVLDISKLESGDMKLEEKPFNMEALITKIFAAVESSASQHSIMLRGGKAASHIVHPELIGSGDYLNRVLMNLASNAIKYNRPGGSVRLYCNELSADPDTACFEFVCEDDGLGMSPDFQRHAFDPFTRENKETTTGFSGSGLGLSIVKELVTMMGGSIQLESEENVGTRFTVRLSFRIDHHAETTVASAPSAPLQLQGRLALLAEDNDLNMEIAEILLGDEGLEIVEAKNGKEALDMFAASAPGQFSCIFMDVMMPVMDGLEATRRIRALERADAQSIPIIAMTANAFTEDREACLAAGMDAHLAKPISRHKLRNALQKYLG